MQQPSTNTAVPDSEFFSIYPGASASGPKPASAEFLYNNAGKIIVLCILGSVNLSIAPLLESTKTVGLPFEISPNDEVRNSAIARQDLGSVVDSIYARDAALPNWYPEAKHLLEQLRRLPDDWRGTKAMRLNDAAYGNAKAFLVLFGSEFPSSPFIYPTTRGDLAIELGKGDKAITMIMRESDVVFLSSTPAQTSAETIPKWDEPPGIERVRRALALTDND